MKSRFTRIMLIAFMMGLPVASAIAATTNGTFAGVNEYSYNTESIPNSKHNTDNHGTSTAHGGSGNGGANSEYNDGSGGDAYDINYLGVDISGGQFQFGVVGGNILTRAHLGVASGDIDRSPLYLGDIAINVTDSGALFEDPTSNSSQSSDWEYAVRILSLDEKAGSFSFSLLQAAAGSAAEWLGLDIYGYEASGGGHNTDTFRMENGVAIADAGGQSVFSGFVSTDSDSSDGLDDYVLEGSFDLSLLSLFDEQTGGAIITYLTMSCANDEAIVYADVSAVPVPAAIWLFGSALLGFIGMSRRTKV